MTLVRVPQTLYHATYAPLVNSILKNGLGGRRQPMWEDSVEGVVYMATDASIAESYAETSDIAYDRFDDVDIVIFEIDTNYLNLDKLSLDRNVLENDGSTFEYNGIIPIGALTLLGEDKPLRRNPSIGTSLRSIVLAMGIGYLLAKK